jgi:hypothetical protein
MNVYCLQSFGGIKLRFDLYKKVNFFPEYFLCYVPSKIACKRTNTFHSFQSLQGAVVKGGYSQ